MSRQMSIGQMVTSHLWRKTQSVRSHRNVTEEDDEVDFLKLSKVHPES